jgi:transcriptional regulator with XRE-family HTH domain
MAPARTRRDDTRQDGAVITELRIQRGFKRAELARRVTELRAQHGLNVPCHPKTMKYIEEQKVGASEEMLHMIAVALGVDRSEIRRQETAA